MSAHRSRRTSNLTVFGARALTAATAFTLLGGGAATALAGEGSHTENRGDYINDSPSSASSSEARVANAGDINLGQDQESFQGVDQLNDQLVDQLQDQLQGQDQLQDQFQDQEQEQEQDEDQEQTVPVVGPDLG